MAQIPDTVAGLRSTFAAGRTKPLAWRHAQLDALRSMLTENERDFESALHADLRKNPAESQVTELGFVVSELGHARKNLSRWLRPAAVRVPGSIMPARASVVREPLGVVLIIAPWNYPVQLLLAPMVGALAAGNAVVLKPSELAPATAETVARLAPRYLDTDAVAVVTGGAEETAALLAEKFDHIFYTGSGRVGRIVAEAAARQLTPVTLELGGKSPVYVDDSVDLPTAADRIAWGKFMNAGQTCVAPDYLLASEHVARRLTPLLASSIHRFYGDDPRLSPDYGRIVSRAHHQRLAAMLGEGRIVVGGDHDPEDRYIAPTVLRDLASDAAALREEVFGPILPIVTVDGPDDAIEHINAGDKPLALYVFSERADVRRRFLTRTSSGALGLGIPAAHLAVSGLPFGGVGASGFGAYHGERSLAAFSHEKAVLSKPLRPDTMRLVYPPYTARKATFIRTLLRRLS